MSEKSKGDTLTRVQNPLLSASVTGLTLDDFPNKPFLLPAAPPVVHNVKPPAVSPGILSKESKSLVTVGSASDIDSENLDEINLNAITDDSPLDRSNTNANPLLEITGTGTESILSQAASSFSALPSVASTVFSTFSKRIYSGSTSREYTPAPESFDSNANVDVNPLSQVTLQTSYKQAEDPIEYSQAVAASVPSQLQPKPPQAQFFTSQPIGSEDFQSSCIYTPSATYSSTPGSNALPPEPPKLYTPADVPPLPATSNAVAGVQNTYRLSARKKIYAPIPGFSGNAPSPTEAHPTPTGNPLVLSEPIPLSASANTFQPVSQTQLDTNNYLIPIRQDPSYQYSYPLPQELTKQEHDRKVGLLGSLTSGVLQNLSGLVQSAADTIASSVKSEAPQPIHGQSPEPTSVNYFGVQDPVVPQQSQSSYPIEPLKASVPQNPLKPSTIFFTPQLSSVPNEPSRKSEGISLTPGLQLSGSDIPPTVQPPPTFGYATKIPSVLKHSVIPSAVVQPPPVAIFNPTHVSPSAVQDSPFVVESQINSSDNSENKSLVAPSVSYCTPEPVEPSLSQSAGVSAPPLPLASVPLLASSTISTPLFPFVANQLPPPPALQGFHQLSPQQTPQSPQPIQAFQPAESLKPVQLIESLQPPQQTQPPPPSGQISFRLQKGTRLYKNPLTAAETFDTQPLLHQSAPQVSSYGQLSSHTYTESGIYNPGISVASATPELFVPNAGNPLQEVPLFVPEEPKPTVQGVENPPSAPPFAGGTSIFEGNIGPAPITKSGSRLPIEIFEENIIESVVPSTPNIDERKSQALAIPTPVHLSEKCDTDSLEQTVQKLADAEPAIGASNASLANFFAPISNSTTTAVLDTGSGPAANALNFFDIQKPTATNSSLQVCPPKLNTTTESVNKSLEPEVQAAGLLVDIHGEPTKGRHTVSAEPSAANLAAVAGLPQLPSFDNAHASLLAQNQLHEQHFIISDRIGTGAGAGLSPKTGIAPPPIGFDNISASVPRVDHLLSTPIAARSAEHKVETDFEQEALTANLSSNYFDQEITIAKAAAVQQPQQLQQTQPQQKQQTEKPVISTASFFDSFVATIPATKADHDFGTFTPIPTVATNALESREQNQSPSKPTQAQEDQRIQNFFNNPPPKENSISGTGDLNYDLVHSGLGIRNLQKRSLTPASNLVEPPSSSCSEFSEFNNSLLGQKVVIDSATKSPPEPIVANLTESPTGSPAENTSSTAARAADIEPKLYPDLPEEVLHELRMANLLANEKNAGATPQTTVVYTPVVKHWFYKRSLSGNKSLWIPFSHYDSALLETSIISDEAVTTLIAVEGGRYDVDIQKRIKMPVYWEGPPIEVRRCSWFFKGTDSKYVPYEEHVADRLEAEYKKAAEANEWHKKVMLAMGEQVVFHGANVIVHFQQQHSTDAWGGSSQTTARPRVVKRDLEDFVIEQGESQRVDHLLFMVHGIGAACDLKMRPVEEVVDDFRNIAQQLVQSHYKNSTEVGVVGRVEVLPISWHDHLHSKEMGIDDKLKSITLDSIPKLRNFTNDTLLDVLFYTSPTYCQKIMNTVASSMNAVYTKYRQRHPEFSGGVSLAGHSLGSLILFDLLCHQKPLKEKDEQHIGNQQEANTTKYDDNQDASSTATESVTRQMSYTMGPAGTGQPFIHYAQLVFQPKKFFALGSPIGMFVTIRGINALGLDFRLPTCAGFYNIFHPFDPVAYRIEALINPDMTGIRPVLIPHHKGRKRMHLELKETMTRVGADLKQRFFDTFKNTLETVNFLTHSAKNKKTEEEVMETEVEKVLEIQSQMELASTDLPHPGSFQSQPRSRTDSTSTIHSESDMIEVDFPLGKLNDSKRIDYVLQEAPLEFFNEYIFALTSHVCYWESEDTILFVIKEIYAGLGISPDSQVPQQTLTIERPSSRNSTSASVSGLETPRT